MEKYASINNNNAIVVVITVVAVIDNIYIYILYK